MRRHLLRLYSVLLLTLILAACGNGPTPQPTRTLLTISPPEALTFIPGCATTDLENWSESSYFLLRDFVAAMNQVETQTPEEVYTTVQRMIPIRDALIAVPAPQECAAEAHSATITLINDTLAELQRFVNGEISDLQYLISEFDVRLGDIQLMQLALEERLESQFSGGQ
jgi:hypothetical protein